VPSSRLKSLGFVVFFLIEDFFVMLWKKTVYNGDAGRAACQCGLVHVLLLAGDSGGGTEGDSVRVERMDLGKEAFLL